MKRRQEMRIRATPRAIVSKSLSCIRNIVIGVSEPTKVEIEFVGEHGPITITLPAALPAWLHMTPEEGATARFEISIRRLRAAPKKREK